MSEVEKRIADLRQKDGNRAYESLRILESISEENDSVYPFMDRFAEMLNDKSSYVRTRGLVLLSANAKWDRDNKLDEIIDDYLKHIMDEKPITARQCIQALPRIAAARPELRESIENALLHAAPGRYKESMCSLIQKDIKEALEKIEDERKRTTKDET